MVSSRQIIDSRGDAGAYLEVMSAEGRGTVYDLVRDKLTVGRTLDNDIVIESQAVSRCHAFFLRSPGGWTVKDNGSKNGVLVNGVRVSEERLRPGDTVAIGDRVFRFGGAAVFVAPVASARSVQQRWGGDEDRSRFLQYGLVTGGLFLLGYAVIQNRPAKPDPVTEALSAKPATTSKPSVVSVMPTMPAPGTSADGAPEPKAPAPETKKVEVSKLSESDELKTYLEEGKGFLKKGEFKRAADAFQIALVIDPDSAVASRGIRAAEYGIKDVDDASLESLPDNAKARSGKSEKKSVATERKRQVEGLLKKAEQALDNKHYSAAISAAEAARSIEVYGETAYLNKAKQFLDQARMRIREEFEPFLQEAKQKFEAGDFTTSRDLCEEMVRRDPDYQEAKACADKARARLEGKL